MPSIEDITKAEIKLKKYNNDRKHQLSCLFTMRSFIFVKMFKQHLHAV